MGWLLHKVLLLVPRSPTPRANCSSRPPMAPEGLGAADRSPTVLLYAAKKAERTSCSRVSRSLRAASLWGGREREQMNAFPWDNFQDPHPHPHVTMLLPPISTQYQASICPVVTSPRWSCFPLKPFLSVLRLLFFPRSRTLLGHWPDLLCETTIFCDDWSGGSQAPFNCHWLPFLGKNRLRHKSHT